MESIDIYVLKLSNDNYYIGKSKHIENRLSDHFVKKSSAWTALYEPISIEKIIINANPFDEDRYVKEYMCKYGIDKVRGGSYISVELDKIQIYNLQREIWNATNCCFNCGKTDHYIKNCKEYIDGVYECGYCNKDFNIEQECKNHISVCIQKKNNNIDKLINDKITKEKIKKKVIKDRDILTIIENTIKRNNREVPKKKKLFNRKKENKEFSTKETKKKNGFIDTDSEDKTVI
jgi:hypothetical protein